jgi:hypothetical protein
VDINRVVSMIAALFGAETAENALKNPRIKALAQPSR